MGVSDNVSELEIRNFLKTYNIINAIVKVTMDTTLDDIETSIFGKRIMRSIFIPIGKQQSQYTNHLLALQSINNYDSLAINILERLNLRRIYTRNLSGEVKNRPLLVEDGSTVEDTPKLIHKDMFRYFKYAKVWREGFMDGVRVGRSFKLEDNDILEIHAF